MDCCVFINVQVPMTDQGASKQNCECTDSARYGAGFTVIDAAYYYSTHMISHLIRLSRIISQQFVSCLQFCSAAALISEKTLHTVAWQCIDLHLSGPGEH